MTFSYATKKKVGRYKLPMLKKKDIISLHINLSKEDYK